MWKCKMKCNNAVYHTCTYIFSLSPRQTPKFAIRQRNPHIWFIFYFVDMYGIFSEFLY